MHRVFLAGNFCLEMLAESVNILAQTSEKMNQWISQFWPCFQKKKYVFKRCVFSLTPKNILKKVNPLQIFGVVKFKSLKFAILAQVQSFSNFQSSFFRIFFGGFVWDVQCFLIIHTAWNGSISWNPGRACWWVPIKHNIGQCLLGMKQQHVYFRICYEHSSFIFCGKRKIFLVVPFYVPKNLHWLWQIHSKFDTSFSIFNISSAQK